MSEVVTLELPDVVSRQAREEASRTRRRMEDVLLTWINRAIAEPPVASLPDDQILALCELQMEEPQQEELSDLLAKNREGLLRDLDRERLDELMQTYRRGLVRKAQALKVAVERGLRPVLN